MRQTFALARVVVAAAIIAAIVAQLSSSLSFAGRGGTTDTGNVLINFFSYFTIDSNVLTVIILLVGATVLLRGSQPEIRRLTVTRAAVTTYMVITGLVYNLLLRGLLVQGATVAWSNEILHVVGPVYLVLDWFLAPGRNSLAWRNALPALAFPIVWVTYTLVRGPLATDPYLHTDYWYPYPFLNPVTSAGGYASVVGYVVGIAIAVIAVTLGLVWTTRRLQTVGSRAATP